MISDELEQLEFKLEKIMGFRNMQEKLEKKSLQYFFLVTSLWYNYENKNNSNRKDITWSILFYFWYLQKVLT